tara:strand:- start:18505 stop:19665 length:1161 start_codon:yes stop_codon:yes gene_type:complete
MEQNKGISAIIAAAKKLRQHLHQDPELAHQEVKTAKKVLEFLLNTNPDEVVEGIGGNGLIVSYKGTSKGKDLLFRAELDALPIEEVNTFEHASKNEKVSHKCGHDGHMAILCGLAMLLKDRDKYKGTVHLLFQPAEETGEGAMKMLEDSKINAFKVDYAFALHNLPGFKMGEIVVKRNTFAAASKGLIVKLKGKPSHASHPKDGINPLFAASQILQLFNESPNMHTALEEVAQITPVGIKMGQKAFGTSASEGEIYATLRTYEDATMERMSTYLEEKIAGIAALHKLKHSIEWTEEFAAVKNDETCFEILENALKELNFEQQEVSSPFPWSEDFGRFSERFPTCMFGLGAGEKHQQLHQEDYDFPDDIISTGVQVFYKLIEKANQQ